MSPAVALQQLLIPLLLLTKRSEVAKITTYSPRVTATASVSTWVNTHQRTMVLFGTNVSHQAGDKFIRQSVVVLVVVLHQARL